MDESSLGTIVFNWIIVFLLLLVNAFFVSAEFAIVRARKTRIEQLTKDGNVDAKLALKALEDMNFFIFCSMGCMRYLFFYCTVTWATQWRTLENPILHRAPIP